MKHSNIKIKDSKNSHSEVLCKYALDENGKLVFIDDVKNGKDCGCICPSCKENMIAKNNGKIKEHHFAHESGHTCAGYKETLLHIWSKEIISNRKCIMLPEYKNQLDGSIWFKNKRKNFDLPCQIMSFSEVELEKEDIETELRPDIIGTISNGVQLWIEIYVSHKCSDEKISKIKEHGINCIEIKIPKDIESKEQLEEFLLREIDSKLKYFINYPYGDSIIINNKKNLFSQLIKQCRKVEQSSCEECLWKKSSPFLQIRYSKFMSENKDKLPNKYFQYIFKYKNLADLIDRYPKLLYLPDALSRDRFKRGTRMYDLSRDEFKELYDFCLLLSQIINEFQYNFNSETCERRIAESIKNGKCYVFCKNI